MSVSPLSRDDYEVPIGFYVEKQTTRIDQKIYNIANSILDYLRANQKILSIAIWSYLCINVAEAMYVINLTPITRLEMCKTTICELWNTTFPPSINVRCNTSDPDYYPFSIFEKCMQTLCEMVDNQAKSLLGCYKYIGQLIVSLELNDSSLIPLNLWNQHCPKGLYNILDTKNQGQFFSQCFKELCSYYKRFPSLQHKLTERACLSLRMDELENKLKEFEQKLDPKSPNDRLTLSMVESGSNIANNFIAAGSIILSLYLTAKMAYKAKEKLMPKLSDGLASIVKGTTRTSMAVANIQTFSTGTTEHVAQALSELSDSVDEIFSDAKCYLSEESNSIYEIAPDSLRETNSIHASLGSQLKPAMLGFGAGTLVGGGIAKALEMLEISSNDHEENKEDDNVKSTEEFVTIATSDLASLVKNTLNTGTKIIQGTVTKNLDEGDHSSVMSIEQIVTKSPFYSISNTLNKTLHTRLYESMFQINFTHDHFETTAEEYNDFILDPVYYNNRIHTESARIENSLEYWNNSICLYEKPNYLLCRSNFYNYIIDLPIMALRTLFSIKNYLCNYFEDHGLWCNWNQFLDLAASKISSTRNITLTNECPSDFVFLTIEKYEDIGTKLNITGDCYREDFFLPWE